MFSGIFSDDVDGWCKALNTPKPNKWRHTFNTVEVNIKIFLFILSLYLYTHVTYTVYKLPVKILLKIHIIYLFSSI